VKNYKLLENISFDQEKKFLVTWKKWKLPSKRTYLRVIFLILVKDLDHFSKFCRKVIYIGQKFPLLVKLPDGAAVKALDK